MRFLRFFALFGALEALFIVVDDAIGEVHHGFCHTKQVGHFLRPIGLAEEIVAHSLPTTIVFHLQIIDVLVVGGEVAWCPV